jgi:signal peptidase
MDSPGDDHESDDSEETTPSDTVESDPDTDEVEPNGSPGMDDLESDPDSEEFDGLSEFTRPEETRGDDTPGREQSSPGSPEAGQDDTDRYAVRGPGEPSQGSGTPGREPDESNQGSGTPGREPDEPSQEERQSGKDPLDRRPADGSPTSDRRAAGEPGGPSRDEWRRERRPRRPRPQETGQDEPSEWALFAYDIVSSVLAVAVIGAYLFAVSGVWPPLVAVESGSMEPNMQVNDLVFVMEENRFPGDGAQASGVVTAQAGQETDYRQFNGYGDVIVYTPNGNEQTTPIIHRAMFWVEEGENWCHRADQTYLKGVDPADEKCIADHSGFITKGDNNGGYDQARGLSGPVRPEWVVGTAEFRVPGLGWIRLQSA